MATKVRPGRPFEKHFVEMMPRDLANTSESIFAVYTGKGIIGSMKARMLDEK